MYIRGNCICSQVNGLDVAAYQPSWLKRRTAVVAQEPVLFAGTIRDNILYARSRSRRSLNQAQGTSNEHGGNSQGNNNSSSSSCSNSRRSSSNCLRLPEHSTTPLSTKKQEKLHVEAVKAAKKAHAADFIESLPMGYDSQVKLDLEWGWWSKCASASFISCSITMALSMSCVLKTLHTPQRMFVWVPLIFCCGCFRGFLSSSIESHHL